MTNQAHRNFQNPDVGVSRPEGCLEQLAYGRDLYYQALIRAFQMRRANPALAPKVDAKIAAAHEDWKALDRDVKTLARDAEHVGLRGLRLGAKIDELADIIAGAR